MTWNMQWHKFERDCEMAAEQRQREMDAVTDALQVLAEERDRLRREYNCASIRAACYLGDAVLASFGMLPAECPACNGDKVIPAHSGTDGATVQCPKCGGR